MTAQTTRWDSAEHLKTDEDIRLYLEACLEEAGGAPAFIVHALGIVARAKNMSLLARDTGLTREGLYKALSEEVRASRASPPVCPCGRPQQPSSPINPNIPKCLNQVTQDGVGLPG